MGLLLDIEPCRTVIPENVCPGFLSGGIFLTGVQGRDPTDGWMSQSHRVWSQGRLRSWYLWSREPEGAGSRPQRESSKNA